MPRGPRRGSKKKPRLSRGFKMTLQRDPTHRHHSEPDNLRCALSALRSIRGLKKPPGGCAERRVIRQNENPARVRVKRAGLGNPHAILRDR